MWTAFLDRLPGWSDFTVLFGLNILLQSTLIILVGLVGIHLLRSGRKRAAVQSLLLRLCLIGVLLAPAAFLLSSAAGMRGLRVTMPLHRTPPVLKPSVSLIHPSSPVLLPATAGKPSELRENSTTPLSSGDKRNAASAPNPGTTRPPQFFNTPVTAPGKTALSIGSASPHRKAAALHQPISSFLNRIPLLLTLAWAALSLFLALRAGAITLYLGRIRSMAQPVHPDQTVSCRLAANDLGIAAPPVLESSYVTSALLTGVFRPVILLPTGESGKAMATREVFLHELAHMARRDPLWLHLCQFAKILLPFQPFLWVLARHIEELSDFACDDYVIHHTGENRPYAAQLIRLAKESHPRSFEASAGTGIISTRFPFLRRLEHILDTSYSRHVTVNANEVMSFSVLFLCAVTLTGFIGFRGEKAETVYAAEHSVRQGGKTFLKKLSRLHVPLTAPVAVLTIKEQRADAALSGATPGAPEEPGKTEPEQEPLTQPEPVDHGPNTTGTKHNPAPVPATGNAMETPPNRAVESENALQTGIPENAGILTADAIDRLPETADSAVTSTKKAEGLHPKTAARDTLSPDWLEMRNSSHGNTEPVTAPSGALKIEIPETAKQALRESLELGQENPVWSPNGEIIAFTGSEGRGIWTVPINGGKPTLRLDNTRNRLSGVNMTTEIARTLGFSPDGSELTFVNYAPESNDAEAAKSFAAQELSPEPVIESVNLLTGVRRRIAEGATEGIWSRDGRYFIYSESDSRGIGVLEISTGKRQVISATGHSPRLTPDGLSIIFVDQGWSDLFYQLYRVPLSGGNPEQLTTDGNWWKPEISPDGEWVICTGYGVSRYNHSSLLRVFSLRERMSYYIRVDGVESAEMGAWSPSGHQFCYTRRGMIDDLSAIRRSAIYIEDFHFSNLNHPETETFRPQEFKLVGNYPNPFNPSTTIRFSLPVSGRAELIICNIAGQKIRELTPGRLEAGLHSIVWNGRDQQNRPVSSGTYVARLKMEGKVATHRMTLVK